MANASGWYEECEQNVKKIDPNAKMCEPAQCEAVSSYLHAFCNCKIPPYQNPCPYKDSTPIPVFDRDGQQCFCCCGFGKEPSVGAEHGKMRAARTMIVGDTIVTTRDGNSWEPSALAFSQGAGVVDPNARRMHVVYDAAAGERSLLAMPDRLVLVASHRLKAAGRLVPGRDRIVLADGFAATVRCVGSSPFRGSVHHLATSTRPASGLDGHLMNCDGVVTADFALQLAARDPRNAAWLDPSAPVPA
jgi:hypothetical protein